MAISTAAHASFLSVFTSGQGYSADADYSPRAWMIHRTRVSKGAAVAHRLHPRLPAPVTHRNPRKTHSVTGRQPDPG
jgi:hypothetical protein